VLFIHLAFSIQHLLTQVCLFKGQATNQLIFLRVSLYSSNTQLVTTTAVTAITQTKRSLFIVQFTGNGKLSRLLFIWNFSSLPFSFQWCSFQTIAFRHFTGWWGKNTRCA